MKILAIVNLHEINSSVPTTLGVIESDLLGDQTQQTPPGTAMIEKRVDERFFSEHYFRCIKSRN